MKKLFTPFICFILLAALLGGCASPAMLGKTGDPFGGMEPVTIKFAHAIPEGELMNYLIEDWMSGVTERSGGKITFDYYPAGKLGTFVEIIEQVELGAVDMSSGEPSHYDPWCPEVSMLYASQISGA